MSAFASQGCSRISSIPNPFDLDISPVVGACSGHGSCVNETCVCTSGWTGRSDLIDTEGLACQVNENVLRGMWGVAAVVAIICFGLSYSKIKQRATDYFATKRRKEAMGKRYTLRNNRGVMASLFHTTLVYPSVLLYALLKEANADERLGLTFGTTLCFFVMKTGCKCSCNDSYRVRAVCTAESRNENSLVLFETPFPVYLAMWAFQGKLRCKPLGYLEKPAP